MSTTINIIDYGRRRYEPVLTAMQNFTRARTANAADEVWLVEHERVFTQGQAGRAEHLLAPGNIEVVQSDRGGQITYHGPGQLVLYPLCTLRRHNMNITDWVSMLEDCAIKVAEHFGIQGATRIPDAPGVYVAGAKLAALGLRVRRGHTYHGLSLNINTDLEPFSRINPCGIKGLQVTSLSHILQRPITTTAVAPVLINAFCTRLNLTPHHIQSPPPAPIGGS